MHILGTSVLTEKKTIPERLLLLYISSSLTNRQFRAQFCNMENLNLLQNSKFINPYLYDIAQDKQRIDTSISPLVYDNKTSSAVEMTRGINGLLLTLTEIDTTLARIKKLDNDSS